MKAFFTEYGSPLGVITLASDSEAIIGIWIEGQRHFASSLPKNAVCFDTPEFDCARKWLDRYFAGLEPDPSSVKVKFIGSEFQKRVWRLLTGIPYGKTMTYGDMARCFCEEYGEKTSPRAVGNAVGRNPISILVPCHRIVGKNGDLTGYAGGIEKKEWLLKHENAV